MCGAKKNTQVGSTQAILSITSSSYKYLLSSSPPLFFAVLLFLGYQQTAIADSTTDKNGFRNSQFLTLTDEQKKYWITGTIEALAYVAAAKSQQQGQCVVDWYYTDTPRKNGLILGSIEKYPDSTPSAVILALTERECGTYRN